MKALLTETEKQALGRSISSEFLQAHAWEEIEFGEVVNAKGRTIFDPGFATAIRKITGVEKP